MRKIAGPAFTQPLHFFADQKPQNEESSVHGAKCARPTQTADLDGDDARDRRRVPALAPSSATSIVPL